VREKQAITLEEGVRKLTSDPADLFGLSDRGRLAKGAPADVAIFDPSRSARPTTASAATTFLAAPSAS
jgi:N-acyl-D-aspartate/D-glutamate deacylase